MSDDIYDEHLDVVQDNEINPAALSRHAPDAVATGGPTWYQGADYGLPDTTVTVVDGTQCVHDGVTYYGGEIADVPAVVAQLWVRSGWATESETEPKSEAKSTPPVKASGTSAPQKRQTAPGSRAVKR